MKNVMMSLFGLLLVVFVLVLLGATTGCKVYKCNDIEVDVPRIVTDLCAEYDDMNYVLYFE